MRAWFASVLIALALSGGPLRAELISDVEYGIAAGERLLLDVRRPAGEGPFPVVIMIHGGGWGSGDKGMPETPGGGADISVWFTPIEQAGILAFSINYRLASAHRWPACLDDVQIAVRWVKAHAADYGGDPSRIALFGHSAGGHLACMAGVVAEDDTRVQAVVGFAPVTDFEQELPIRGGVSLALQNLHGLAKEVTPEALEVLRASSPINHVRPGLPPFLILHGDADKTVPSQQTLNFQAKLREARVSCELITLPGAPHRLSEWAKHDPAWPRRLVAWLRRTLESPAPDLVVSARGDGDFATIGAALRSIPVGRRERTVVWIRDGVYREKVRIDADCVTLRGESRDATIVEFAQGMNEFSEKPDLIGRAVINIEGDDCVIEAMTVRNTHGVIGPHAFAIFGRGDRTVVQDANVWSHGADTLSLWANGGRYYHARLDVKGSVDFVCPRGWCFMRDSVITQVNPGATAAIWHDGSRARDMKFVLRDCRFDGPPDWYLARHHADAQFYLLDATFSATMRDRAPYRVIYPLGDKPATEADIARNRELDKKNLWGERFYFWNCHRDGGDYAWHADNLVAADGAPTPGQITPAWTFAATWDPERTDAPRIDRVEPLDSGEVVLTFSEVVTVKGVPTVVLRDGRRVTYVGGSGSRRLTFGAAREGTDLGGVIIASEAGAWPRRASLTLPAK
ncbi:MAG: alpha/beta hydrolase fold domain-containing protein [Opitutaceae bacterium]|nr:alpha/beta hydrolase fold domain-containing protein [Opitutaceae bacterium]